MALGILFLFGVALWGLFSLGPAPEGVVKNACNRLQQDINYDVYAKASPSPELTIELVGRVSGKRFQTVVKESIVNSAGDAITLSELEFLYDDTGGRGVHPRKWKGMDNLTRRGRRGCAVPGPVYWTQIFQGLPSLHRLGDG